MPTLAKSASLVITLAGGLTHTFLTLQLAGSWGTLRALDAESELDAWKLDGLRVLWALLAAYLIAGAFVSFVGFFGVLRELRYDIAIVKLHARAWGPFVSALGAVTSAVSSSPFDLCRRSSPMRACAHQSARARGIGTPRCAGPLLRVTGARTTLSMRWRRSNSRLRGVVLCVELSSRLGRYFWSLWTRRRWCGEAALTDVRGGAVPATAGIRGLRAGTKLDLAELTSAMDVECPKTCLNFEPIGEILLRPASMRGWRRIAHRLCCTGTKLWLLVENQPACPCHSRACSMLESGAHSCMRRALCALATSGARGWRCESPRTHMHGEAASFLLSLFITLIRGLLSAVAMRILRKCEVARISHMYVIAWRCSVRTVDLAFIRVYIGGCGNLPKHVRLYRDCSSADLAFTAFLTLLAFLATHTPAPARAACEQPELGPLLSLILTYLPAPFASPSPEEACDRALQHAALFALAGLCALTVVRLHFLVAVGAHYKALLRSTSSSHLNNAIEGGAEQRIRLLPLPHGVAAADVVYAPVHCPAAAESVLGASAEVWVRAGGVEAAAGAGAGAGPVYAPAYVNASAPPSPAAPAYAPRYVQAQGPTPLPELALEGDAGLLDARVVGTKREWI
ncbi:hypothetical protein DFH06DRAFT_1314253 [Mycena polygramma]|nr:hypothetical protein DFH06DRAFT_1314253 [Mycena polygramma]